MATERTDYSYIGSGKIYLRERSTPGGLMEVGNCSALNFTVTEEVKEQKDYTQPGGGTYNEVRRITSIEMTKALAELKPSAIARATYGSVSDVEAGAITNEHHAAYPGAFLPFVHLPAASPAWTVVGGGGAVAAETTTAYDLGDLVTPDTPNGYFYECTTAGTSAGTAPTWPTTVGATVTDGTVVWTNRGKTTLVEGEDYEKRPSGILILEDAALDAGARVTVGYTKALASVVQMLVNSGKEYEMVFDGLNEARSGKRSRVTAFRVKIGAAQDLGLIGDEYAVLESTGKILKDLSITGEGLSQYVRMEIEQ